MRSTPRVVNQVRGGGGGVIKDEADTKEQEVNDPNLALEKAEWTGLPDDTGYYVSFEGVARLIVTRGGSKTRTIWFNQNMNTDAKRIGEGGKNKELLESRPKITKKV